MSIRIRLVVGAPFYDAIDEEIRVSILNTLRKINQVFLVQLLIVIVMCLMIQIITVSIPSSLVIISYQVIDHLGMLAVMVSIMRLISRTTPYLRFFRHTKIKACIIRVYILSIIILLTMDLVFGIIGWDSTLIYAVIVGITVASMIPLYREIRILALLLRTCATRRIFGMIGLYGVLTCVNFYLNSCI